MSTHIATENIAAGYDAVADQINMPAEFYDGLRAYVGEVRGLKVLDAGCGNGYFTQRLAEGGPASLDGFEYSEELTRRAQHRLGDRAKITNGSLEEPLPYADESFDLITLTEVIEHLPNPDKALKNLARVLKKDGRLIISFPNAGGYPLWKWGEKNFESPLGYLMIPAEHPKKTFQPIDTLLTPEDVERLVREAGMVPERWAGTRPWPWCVEVRFRRAALKLLNPFMSLFQALLGGLSKLPGGHKLCYRVSVTCRKRG